MGFSIPFRLVPASSSVCRISSLASLLFVLPQRRNRVDSNELWQSTVAPNYISFRAAPEEPSRAATISGVLLQEFLASMVAPAAAKISIASALSYSVASPRGVSLLMCSLAMSSTSRLPLAAATWSGLHPLLSKVSTEQSFQSMFSTIETSFQRWIQCSWKHLGFSLRFWSNERY